jgi:hypothetical protein
MAATTKQEFNPLFPAPRVHTPTSIPTDHYKPIGKGKYGVDYVEVRQTDRSKAYASNRTKPRKKHR